MYFVESTVEKEKSNTRIMTVQTADTRHLEIKRAHLTNIKIIDVTLIPSKILVIGKRKERK